MFGIVCDQLSYWVYIFLWVLPLCIPISYLLPLRKVKRIVWGGYYSFFFWHPGESEFSVSYCAHHCFPLGRRSLDDFVFNCVWLDVTNWW